MRLNNIGFYKEIGLYKERIDGEYQNAMQTPKFADPVKFNFKYSNGQGLTKEEYALFQGWLVQSGSYVIETSVNLPFNKGDKLTFDGGDNMIQRVIEKTDHSRLNGNKTNFKKVKVIFCG